MSETNRKWAFRLVTIFAPVVIAALDALRAQVDGGEVIDWRPITSAGLSSLVIAFAHLMRVLGEGTGE